MYSGVNSFNRWMEAAEPNQVHLNLIEDNFGMQVEALYSEGMKGSGRSGLLTTAAFGTKVVKPVTSAGVRLFTMPANIVLAKHLFEGATLACAWKQTLKDPFAGSKKAVTQVFAESGLIFLTRDLFKDLLIEQGLMEQEHQAEAVAGLAAAIVGTVATQPLVRASFKEQISAGQGPQNDADNKKSRKVGYKQVRAQFRGAGPASLKNVCTWSVGLTLGSILAEKVKETQGDSNSAKLGAKVIGWLIGGAIGSPFFNIQRHLQKDDSAKGMVDVLRKKGVIYQPKLYVASEFSPSAPVRFILGMPLDQKSISPEETSRLKIYRFAKEFPRFGWRGFLKGSPLIAIGGLAVASAEVVAQRFFHKQSCEGKH